MPARQLNSTRWPQASEKGAIMKIKTHLRAGGEGDESDADDSPGGAGGAGSVG